MKCKGKGGAGRLKGMRRALALLVLCSLSLGSVGLALGKETTGIPSVVDGDTLDLRGTRFRLHGVDAPESSQTCLKGAQVYRCGQQVALALADHIGKRNVTCEEGDRDRYGRVVAVCRMTATGEDLNRWLVRQGLAVAYTAYSRDYAGDEVYAKQGRLGLWAGSFVRPEVYRKTGGTAAQGSSASPRSATTVFRSCAEVRAAGRAPLRRGEPGYSPALDRDGDGRACER